MDFSKACCKVDTSASSGLMQVHWRRIFQAANYLERSLRAKQLVGPSQNNSRRRGYSVFSWVLIGRSSCICACASGCRGVSGLQSTAACRSVCCHTQFMGVLPHHSESSCNSCWNEMSSLKKKRETFCPQQRELQRYFELIASALLYCCWNSLQRSAEAHGGRDGGKNDDLLLVLLYECFIDGGMEMTWSFAPPLCLYCFQKQA